jgi:repressor LexA
MTFTNEASLKKPKTPFDERIVAAVDKIIAERGLKNDRQFLLKHGLSPSLLTKLRAGVQSAPKELVNILATDYQVSLPYMETGNGRIFAQPSTQEVQPITFLNELPSVELPFVSVHARASYIGLGGASVDARSFDTVHLTLMSPDEASKYEGAVVFEVNGDSMQPLLHSGQRVIAWPLDEAKWEQVHNKVCVVAYDDTVTIKAVRSNDLFTKNMLVLHALDERVGYLPVSRRSIRSIWFVDEFFDRPKVRL